MPISARWPGEPNKEITSFGGLSRSDLMSRVRSQGNSTTELRLAHLLREAGLRGWRRHYPVDGKPDFVWRKELVAVFVDGCFWHGHDCGRNLVAKTNAESWSAKIERNRRRDARVNRTLRKGGWSVIRIWECRLRRFPESSVARIRRKIEQSKCAT